jgi:hypothetical protein
MGSSTGSSTLTRVKPAPHRFHRDFRLPLRLCGLARRRWWCWAALGVAMILSRVALLPVLPVPDPVYMDEFSYLLAGDTFAHGRAANPAPAHPEFFESPHVLVRPTYASKYPPGQGLALALGERLAGHPYWGVVASGALMIVLLCWMAEAWLPPQWALLAGAIAWVLFFVRHYWFTSYWGGNLAACGGALAVGALGCVLRGRVRAARVGFALGAILLYCTRPYEGAVLCGAIGIGLAFWLVRQSSERKRAFARGVLLPNAALLALAVPFLLLYNARVTGHVAEMPAVLYASQYDTAPKFWFLPALPAKEYTNANLRKTHEWELELYQKQLTPWLAARGTDFLLLLFEGVWMQFTALGLLLLALPWARLRGGKRWVAGLLAAGAAALLLEVGFLPHYTAPFTPVLLLAIAGCARSVWYRLSAIRLGAPLLGLMLCLGAIFVVRDYTGALQNPGATPRAQLMRQLAGKGGRHLVFVDYAEGWNFHDEWVYNGADLNGKDLARGAVVLAHARGDAENRELSREYADRTAWLLKLGPGSADVSLQAYPAAEQ